MQLRLSLRGGGTAQARTSPDSTPMRSQNPSNGNKLRTLISRKLVDFSQSPDRAYVSLLTDGPEIRVWFVTEDTVRIRASFDRTFEESSYVLTTTAWSDNLDAFMGDARTRVAPVVPTITDEEDVLSLSTSSLTLKVRKARFSIEIFDADHNLLHKDVTQRAFVRDHLGMVMHYSEREPTDRYYGFGEHTGPLNKFKRRLRLKPTDAAGWDPKRQNALYKHIPFYVKLQGQSRRAMGMFYHNLWESEFDLGAEHNNYFHEYSYFQAQGGDIDLFFINGPSIANVIERYTDLTGKSCMLPKYALGYLGSTMYYTELPKDSDKEIIDFIDQNREEGIPVDNFHLSSGYSSDPKTDLRFVFTWNNERFPDPAAYFSAMIAKGVMNTPNVKPGVLLTHPDFNEFLANDAFVKTDDSSDIFTDQWWGGEAAFVDFTNPMAREFWKGKLQECWGGETAFVDFTNEMARELWKKKLQEALLQYGITSVWNDNCEYDLQDQLAQCFGDGSSSPVGALKAILPNLMCQMSHEAIATSTKDKARPFVVCRSGGPGIQRHAQTWCGDNDTSWDSLKYTVAVMLGMSMSGVSHQGADVGGFTGIAPGPELFLRWVQHGVLTPRFSIHSANEDNTVTVPWLYEEHIDRIRSAILLRYSLIPYLYSLTHESHITGVPMMRPLVYEFQNDPSDRVLDESFQFMLGESLMVSSILDEGVKTHDVYFPGEPGTFWYDYHTRQRYGAGETVTLDVDLDSIPLFLREGAIVPTTNDLFSLVNDEVETLHLICVPPTAELIASAPEEKNTSRDKRLEQISEFVMYEDDGETNEYKEKNTSRDKRLEQISEFVVYEDDGETNEYKSGSFLETTITMTGDAQSLLEIDVKREGRFESTVKNILLDVVNGSQGPTFVEINEETVERFLDRKKWEKAETGWIYNKSRGKVAVLIKFPSIAGDFKVTMDFTAAWTNVIAPEG